MTVCYVSHCVEWDREGGRGSLWFWRLYVSRGGRGRAGACVLLVESFGFNTKDMRSSDASQSSELKSLVPDSGFVGCPVLKCALSLAVVAHLVAAIKIVQQYPFTPERKMMSTLVALDPTNVEHGPVRLYVTGAYACACQAPWRTAGLQQSSGQHAQWRY